MANHNHTTAPAFDQLKPVTAPAATIHKHVATAGEPNRAAERHATEGDQVETRPNLTRRHVMNMLVSTTALVAATPAAAAVSGRPNLAEGALERMEFIVNTLRTRYVCQGFKLDEEAADRALRYFRSFAAGEPEVESEWYAALDFLSLHGQSTDWVILGDPSGMICRNAARSEHASLVSDPIHAAIRRRQAAWDAYGDALRALDPLEESLPADKRKWQWSTWSSSPPPDMNDAPEWTAGQLALRDAAAEESRALIDLVEIEPTTLVGVDALLTYAAQCHSRREDWTDEPIGEPDPATGQQLYCEILPTMLESLRGALRKIAA